MAASMKVRQAHSVMTLFLSLGNSHEVAEAKAVAQFRLSEKERAQMARLNGGK
jgi:hypothetical protein